MLLSFIPLIFLKFLVLGVAGITHKQLRLIYVPVAGINAGFKVEVDLVGTLNPGDEFVFEFSNPYTLDPTFTLYAASNVGTSCGSTE